MIHPAHGLPAMKPPPPYSYIRRNARRAFTLTELLVVIAIIGILVAITIPVVGSARQNARTAQCQSNIRQWTVAAQLHAAENKGKLPDTGYVSKATGAQSHFPEPEMISYMNVPLPNNATTQQILDLARTMHCPVEGWRYGFNSYLAWEPITKFTQPVKQIFATCSTKAWFDGTAQTHTTDYLGRIPKPHSRKVNVAYLDGSVSRAS